jgi:hypothetical protein
MPVLEFFDSWLRTTVGFFFFVIGWWVGWFLVTVGYKFVQLVMYVLRRRDVIPKPNPSRH